MATNDAEKNKVAGILLLDPPPLDWILCDGFSEMTKLTAQTSDNFEKLSENMISSNNLGDKRKAEF